MTASEDYLASLIAASSPVVVPDALARRADTALDLAADLGADDPELYGHSLAAFFDLLVADAYYQDASAANWTYCPRMNLVYYPYTNACPGCLQHGLFTFTKGKKPGAGTIGAVVARVLKAFVARRLLRIDPEIEVLHAGEPVDLLVVSALEHRVFAGEIKAAPLITLPLAVSPAEVNVTRRRAHFPVDLADISSASVAVPAVPVESSDYRLVPAFASSEGLWGELASDRTAAEAYVRLWRDALAGYGGDNTRVSRWLANGCGTPSPVPENWPLRPQGRGPESISDGKTSVGMDRTDDIKKAIYQILKVGVELRSTPSHFRLHTGIVSNVHAIRHGEGYLSGLLDIVWAHGGGGRDIEYVEDLPSKASAHYLIDGLVALTNQKIQDPWVERLFGL